MTQLQIDLNCDLGEYEQLSDAANDAAIMTYISSCNVACGAHAGNQAVIEHTVELALASQVQVGAHPSYPDRKHFGRRVMPLSEQELKATITEQIQAIKATVVAQGSRMTHVKPHGALYNQAAADYELAVCLAEVVAAIDSRLLFYGLAHSAMAQAAHDVGLNFVAEGFADRAYTAAGQLVPRSQPGAVITEVNEMSSRVLRLLKQGRILAINGAEVDLRIDTLCIHGDHKGSLETAASLHHQLLQSGIAIQAPAVHD